MPNFILTNIDIFCSVGYTVFIKRQCDVDDWHDIVTIAAGEYHTIGLRSDGTVVECGLNEAGQCAVGGWRDIIAIDAGDYHTAGLRRDGTVVACGLETYGACSVAGWRDVCAIAAGGDYTLALVRA